MQKLYCILDRILTAIMIMLVVAMVLCITTEIVLREVVGPLGDNPAWISAVSRPINTASQSLLVWIGILGSALALKLRMHLGMDALVRVYPPRVRLFMDYLQTALVLAFSVAVLLYGGWQVCAQALRINSMMPGFESFNRAWFYSVLVISGSLNVIYCIFHFIYPKPVGCDEQLPAPAPAEEVEAS